MTFDAGRRGSECFGVALAYPDGIPSESNIKSEPRRSPLTSLIALFTGSSRQQEVRLWDIRAKTTVYELSTGNTNVTSLAWDDKHNTLYAAAECDYVDRNGFFYDYRRAKIPKFMRDEESLANRHPDAMDEDYDDEEEEEEYDDDDDYDEED
ncbi:hypothetical protein H0H93_003569, partial [Arthromyces matolae]